MKKKQMNSREAILDDLETIRGLLDICKLPSVDCAEHLNNFVLVEKNDKVVGVGSLEVYDNVGLVRSVAVLPNSRNSGVGKMIYELIEKKAIDLGVRVLYLLTESADKYFSNLGFSVKNRNEAPLSIMKTKQFKDLCPSTAKVMYREL